MLTQEDLQAIATLTRGIVKEEIEPINKRLDKVDERLDKVDERLDKVDERLDKVDERLDSMEEQLNAIKEDGEITRTATEEILKWFDKWYRNDHDKKFPIDDEPAS